MLAVVGLSQGFLDGSTCGFSFSGLKGSGLGN